MEVENGLPKSQIYSRIPTTNDLRLLCLLGWLRKLWKRLILRRITLVWDKHNALNEAQHCRSGRGCSDALLYSQAALETHSQESGTDIYEPSWNIQRARTPHQNRNQASMDKKNATIHHRLTRCDRQ